ncbi:FAD binding domain protein [Mycobacterium xenopi 4042]|uniref:FAD binding domain protein n=1 Tax=Mycobacterium xenopi 4042 TaxID=1299334 RepID=X8BL84_MYCXE|nr:FAD binding domain protein [Mycobacterium xenopi 4042]
MLQQLAEVVGRQHVSADPDVLAARSVDHTGRYRGHASVLVRPGSTGEVAEVLRVCRGAAAHVTVQGGRTSLVAGTVPEHDDVLLSTERLNTVGEVDAVERRLHVGAGRRWPPCSRRPAPRGWYSVSTWPPATPPPSAAWPRPMPAACGRCATATWASRCLGWTLRCPTARCCAGTAGCAPTTPATTCRRCSSAPRAPSASSPHSTCGCTPPRRTG